MEQLLTSFNADTLIYMLLGGIGGFIGSLVRIIKRDAEDLEDKLQFFYVKDIFAILVWTLVGAYAPVAAQFIGSKIIFIPPALILMLTPFMPKAWDDFEKNIPGLISKLMDTIRPNPNKPDDKGS